jgi:hypothetical protein
MLLRKQSTYYWSIAAAAVSQWTSRDVPLGDASGESDGDCGMVPTSQGGDFVPDLAASLTFGG